jgi:phenylalanyl-tRNA synthetase alpha chain
MEFDAKSNDRWSADIGGCGMLKSDMLREAGHNPEKVHGYAFGLGLERLAMSKFGLSLKSVHALWWSPYLQAQS